MFIRPDREWKQLTYDARNGTTIGLSEIEVRVDSTAPVNLHRLRDDERVFSAMALLRQALDAEILASDPNMLLGAQAKKENLLKAFGRWGAMHTEIPNRYWRPEDPWAKYSPWFRVATPIGILIVGWRKHVIHLEWTDSFVTKTAKEIFSDEDVTKIEKIIHAGSYEKLQAYIQTLMEIASAQLLPMVADATNQQTPRIG